jgi:HEPN domain-containing protein
MTPALDEARRLLRLALRDGDTFALLFPLPQATIAALGFHAQQAVEKALKAVCTRQNMEVRRTHDLAALGQTLLDRGTALPISVDELRSLNPFAVEFRYDDEITSSMKREELDTLLRAVLSWAGTEVDR